MLKNDNQTDTSGNFVGFACLPNQVHRKIAKRGFEFTIMVVGESGLGKATLVNNLFLTDLYSERHLPTAQEKLQNSIKIESSTVEIDEHGVKVRLTIVNTFGYGDNLDCSNNQTIISNYIDQQFQRYLIDESGLNRRNISDNRIHCLLYFISPFSRGLKPLDIECMKALHNKVNIIPVIGKADALTSNELAQMKQTILKQIDKHQIEIYRIPDCESDEDDEIKEQNQQLKQSLPFAVISSAQTYEIKGKQVRARMYPWGLVEIENSAHCDFLKLRTMLTMHMQDLQEITHEIHYENYRTDKLQLKNSLENNTKQRKLIEEKDHELHRMQQLLTKLQRQLSKS